MKSKVFHRRMKSNRISRMDAKDIQERTHRPIGLDFSPNFIPKEYFGIAPWTPVAPEPDPTSNNPSIMIIGPSEVARVALPRSAVTLSSLLSRDGEISTLQRPVCMPFNFFSSSRRCGMISVGEAVESDERNDKTIPLGRNRR
jgi:hypothetical protein